MNTPFRWWLVEYSNTLKHSNVGYQRYTTKLQITGGPVFFVLWILQYYILNMVTITTMMTILTILTIIIMLIMMTGDHYYYYITIVVWSMVAIKTILTIYGKNVLLRNFRVVRNRQLFIKQNIDFLNKP